MRNSGKCVIHFPLFFVLISERGDCMQDAQILDLYFDRDERAIEETDKKYGDYCHAIAMNILRSREDSQECVNDTWLKAWNAIPPQRPKLFRQFLAKITRHLSFDRYRTDHAQKRGGGEMPLVLEELHACVGSGDPATEMEFEELKSQIREFLQGLPERDRGIFLRRYFYVEEIPAIARRYMLRQSNVRLILSRTRQKLKDHLQKEGFVV